MHFINYLSHKNNYVLYVYELNNLELNIHYFISNLWFFFFLNI